MRSAEIRQSFLDFFKSKGHTVVPSASLLPSAPNLLFTNAGMNPFVPCFLGEQTSPAVRVANTQKCLRAGGKHNDLEGVGFDAFHHTFFEMLGNWSFGDYFKREAIAWAWELLTSVWPFPANRLYATVYRPEKGEPACFDQEAYDRWKAIFENAGLDPQKHIQFGNKKDNFWMMGETGPCGPCSEIHIDLTPEGDSQGRLVNQDSPWCIEIWNLVFIQCNAQDDGSFTPLPTFHIDTGMGFERVAGILATTQGFQSFSRPPSNYDSDLFTDMFAVLTEVSGHSYQGTLPENLKKSQSRATPSDIEEKDCAFRILADHSRALALCIADGIFPGNEGRNYVLRRILRRALLFGRRLALPSGFFKKLTQPLIEKLGPVFSELKQQQEVIQNVIQSEEQAFERTLERGLQLIDKISSNITGKQAFTLYDTYGFPIDLTQLIARRRGLQVDLKGFQQAMQAQRLQTQAAQKKAAIRVVTQQTQASPTQFVGFEQDRLTDCNSTVTHCVSQGEKTFAVFDKTPFYAEGGGQIGDSGKGVLANGQTFRISDTLRDPQGQFLHQIEKDGSQPLPVGEQVRLSVDVERRQSLQQHHSATHIVHWALREVLGIHVRQAGSLVTPQRLRFDFTHYEALSPQQTDRIESLANQRILENATVSCYEVSFDQKPANCIAFFGEKYGGIVRVVDIGGYSLELCGGTHVRATGEIGLCAVVSETAIAAGVRRIEAVAGKSALALFATYRGLAQSLAERLSCPLQELETGLDSLLAEQAALLQKLEQLQQKGIAAQTEDLVAQAVEQAGLRWVVAQVRVDTPATLRSLAVTILKKIQCGVVILGSHFENKTIVLALCSQEGIKAGYRAGDLIQTLTHELGGKGGGKADFAMGGASAIAPLAAVLKRYPHCLTGVCSETRP